MMLINSGSRFSWGKRLSDPAVFISCDDFDNLFEQLIGCQVAFRLREGVIKLIIQHGFILPLITFFSDKIPDLCPGIVAYHK